MEFDEKMVFPLGIHCSLFNHHSKLFILLLSLIPMTNALNFWNIMLSESNIFILYTQLRLILSIDEALSEYIGQSFSLQNL